MKHLAASLLALLCSAAVAAELRVASFNVGGDFVNECGICAPGTEDHEAVRAVLDRIDADVVALQEIFNNDLDGDPDDVDALAAALGYPHVHTPALTSLDFNLRTIFLSRFPFLDTDQVSSPEGAYEIARRHPVVTVDVPGTDRDPVIVSVHLKSGNGNDDRFRRAVEMRRLDEYLDSRGLSDGDNLIVLGDFNLDLDPNTSSYLAEPTGLPGSFDLGDDIRAEFAANVPLVYTEFPEDYLSSPDLVRLDCRMVNGDTRTIIGGRRIDHILLSPALAARGFACEIYDSFLETHPNPGLPKAGSPLFFGTSGDASDHWPVFVDLDLDDDTIFVAASAASIGEDDPAGSATLTVTLPVPPGPGETIRVTLSPDLPAEALASPATLDFTSGVTQLTADIIPQVDGIPDGNRTVTFTASASGLTSGSASIEVLDTTSPTYLLSGFGTAAAEDFDGFDGLADHPRWVADSSELDWSGADDGSAGDPGLYSFGAPADPSLGAVPGAAPTSFAASFRNATGTTLTALELGYTAEQWHGAAGGSADTIRAELLTGGSPVPLPPLDFTAATDLDGAVGVATPLVAVVEGLSVPAGAEFLLRFTIARGAGGALPSADVFLNEIHYDNNSSDTGEFLEVVAGPGFVDPPGSVEVVLYNGSNGEPYETIKLADFDNAASPTVVDGYEIYHRSQAGIQNGSPDGIAVVVDGGVSEFLSYEGSFTATSGPANGMTSSDIGVSQTASTPVGLESLIRTGSGSRAGDFSWARIDSEPHSPGAANAGQSFVTPVFSQGLAVDDVRVTALLDSDLDGTPDLSDPDDDNDGLSDDDEGLLGTDPLLVDTDSNGIDDPDEDADGDGFGNLEEIELLGTDPLDPGSRFAVAIIRSAAGPFELRFPSKSGTSYTVESGPAPDNLGFQSSHPGIDGEIVVPISSTVATGSRGFFRVRATPGP